MDRESLTTYQREWTSQRRSQAIFLLGGKCIRCGSTENLEIDHVDPSTKSFSIGQFGSHSWDDIVEELDKCQLLCHDCHVKKTREDKPPRKRKSVAS